MVSARSAPRPYRKPKCRRQSARGVDNLVASDAAALKCVRFCEWLSHCGALYNSPGAATGTKEGSSCRFKKDVFSTACEAAVRIIFFSPLHLPSDRKASPDVLSWAALPINTALSVRGKTGVSDVSSPSLSFENLYVLKEYNCLKKRSMEVKKSAGLLSNVSCTAIFVV